MKILVSSACTSGIILFLILSLIHIYGVLRAKMTHQITAQ